MINVREISNLNDSIPKEYSGKLRQCTNSDELMELLEEYRPLADRAYSIIKAFSPTDTVVFLAALKHDTEETPMVDAAHLEIAMPSMMIAITLQALRFKVPFGAMLNRLLELDRLEVVNGVLEWTEKSKRERKGI